MSSDSETERQAPAPRAARHEELERAILEAPEEPQHKAVYADWLIEQGDPRGELISLHSQLAQHRNDVATFASLKSRIEKHVQLHQRAIFGPVAADQHLFKVDWHLGFIRGLRLSFAPGASASAPFEEVLAHLLRLPAAMLLQDLGLGLLGRPDPENGRYLRALDVIARQGPSLRSLCLGDDWAGKTEATTQRNLADLRVSPEVCHSLQKFTVIQGFRSFHENQFPNLRELDVRPALEAHDLSPLFADPWRRLERLGLSVGHSFHLGVNTAHQLTRRRFPSLQRLRLSDSMQTRQMLETLAGTDLLPQLNTLDVANGDLNDTDVEALARRIDSFRHLKLLHLGEQNGLTPRSKARLKDWSFVSLKPTRFFGDLSE